MCVRMPRPSCPHPSIPRQVPRLPDGRFPEVPLLCSCTPWQMPPTHTRILGTAVLLGGRWWRGVQVGHLLFHLKSPS